MPGPTTFGADPAFANATGTMPAPAPVPGSLPVAVWYGADVQLDWTLTATVGDGDASFPLPPGYLYSATWMSPTFDLRPDLKSSQGALKSGMPITTVSGRLRITLRTSSESTGEIPAINTTNLTVSAVDYINAFSNPNMSAPNEAITGGAGLYSTPPIDVSARFASSGNTTSVLAGFAPPGTNLGGGEGYPVRYWRLVLTFTQFIETGLPLPGAPGAEPLILRGSYY